MSAAEASLGLRDVLSARSLHRELCSMVRRRVPPAEVEDVVQAVLCDALASARPPLDPGEIPRWVMGIARHKVADFHRRARREEVREVVQATPLMDPVEDREMLRAVLEATREQPAERETMHWVLREYEGERLCDIAHEARLPAEVVRQRVSRLRRVLRSRWLLAAAAALVFVAWAGHTAKDSFERRYGLPVDRPVPPQAAEPSMFQISEVTLPPGFDPAMASWVRAEAKLATVRWSGEELVITTPTRTLEGSVLLSRGEDGRLGGSVLLDGDRSYPVRVTTEGLRAVIELTGPHDGVVVVLEPRR